MSIAKLEFNIPEEKEEFNNAVNGGAYRYILAEIDNELRNKLKYSDEKMSKDTEYAYRLVRQRISDLLIEENLEI